MPLARRSAIAALTLIGCLQLSGQNWSGVLSPNRAVDWSGVGASSIPARSTVCNTLSSGASMAAIQAAVAACPSGQTVLLNPGTYTTSVSLVLNTSNVTLRGANPKTTILKFTGTSTNCLGIGPVGVCITNGDSGTLGGTANVLALTGGVTQGSTSVTVGGNPGNICGNTGTSACPGSLANLQVGSLAVIRQHDDTSDPGNAYFCGSTACSQQADNGNAFPNYSQIQIVTVTGKSGSTVTFTPALSAPNWTSGKSPIIGFSSSLPVSAFGLENLTVDTTSLGSMAAQVQFVWATNSWVKNVSLINATPSGLADAAHKHVWISSSAHNTVRDSYMYGSSPSSEGYGIDFWESSDNLAENNICQKIATCEIMEGGNGNVFGYHYAVDNNYTGGGFSPNWQQCDQFHHNAGDYYNLWEGNIGTCHTEDSIHGTAFANTLFRNALSGFDPNSANPKTDNTLSINNMAYARYINYVGNVVGYGGKETSYQYVMTSATDCGVGNRGWAWALDDSGQNVRAAISTCGDPYTLNNDVVAGARPSVSDMRWGNWDAINGTRFVGSESGSSANTYPGLLSPASTFPSSFYISGSAPPSWWTFPSGSNSPWPGIGSDISGGNISGASGHAWLNPAGNCYLNVLGGAVNGSSGSFQSTYDAASCYTGSSPSQVVAPTLTPGAGTYTGTQSVVANSGTTGATLCYRVDGVNPAATTPGTCDAGSSTLANGGTISVSSSETIKILGTKASFTNSTITSAAYVINPAVCADPIQAGPNFSGTYYVPPTTFPINVQFSSPTAGCVMHGTTDGSTPNCSSATYPGGGYNISALGTYQYREIACQSGFTSSNVVGGSWVVLNGQVVAPTFTPPAGNYTSPQSVILATPTPAASIYYTTDGSTPTTSSTLYTGAITISTTTTLKAMAAATGLQNSGVTTGVYTITARLTAPTFSPVAGSYTSTQSVTISAPTPSTVISATEGSNGNASTGDAPNRNIYTNCGTGYSGGAVTPHGEPVGELWCTTADKTAGEGAGGPTQGVVSANVTGIGTTPVDNGNGAGGVNSATNVTSTFGGANANGCPVGTSITSVYQPGLTLLGNVAAAHTVYGAQTGTPPNTSMLAPTKWVYSGGDAALYYVRETCQKISITTVTGEHLEWDTNHHLSGNDYFGFGVHYNWTDHKLYYCPQGCSSWQAMNLVEANGTVHTTFTWPGTDWIYTQFYEHRTSSCSSSSGSNCMFYDYLCYQDYTAGTARICGVLQDASSGLTPGGIPVSLPSWTRNEFALQHQIDINQSSGTVLATVDFDNLVAYSLTGSPTICYTINNTTPTTDNNGNCTGSTLTYSGPLSVSTTTTIKAVATQAGYLDSTVSTASYTINGQLPTPTYSPTAGGYGPAQNVTISDTVPTATLRYTTSGTDPTCSTGTVYSTPVAISSTTTLKAIACQATYLDSNVASGVYTINGTVATPTFSPVAGTYGPSQSVTISTVTGGATIRYTTSGTAPTCSTGTVYSGPVSVSSSLTLKAIGCETGFTDSGVGSAAYVINGAVATPVFSPVAGTYTSVQAVTISTSTPGAGICYTNDGTTPVPDGAGGCTTGTLYSVTITVGTSQTLKAVGFKSGFSNSSTASAAYVISIPPPPSAHVTIGGKAVASGKVGVQ